MDTALKQRLVGASVLIALAVVVLPMLLGGRLDSGSPETQKIELPTQPPELDFQSRKYPVGERPAPRPTNTEPATAKALPTPGPVSDSVSQTGSGTLPEPTSQERLDELTQGVESTPGQIDPGQVNPEQESPEPVEDVVTANSGRYVVQVASFGALENANRLAGTLRSVGYSVLLDTIKSDVGTLHRVRVGPYSDESKANAAVGSIQSQIKNIKPRVMDLQPDQAARVTQPSDPLIRWVVQVGSFSDAANADNLVARLRLESMSAYKEQVTRSGSAIYRVRVGPFLAREDAMKANNRVSQRLSIDGVVMSAQ
jgi:DedD protein